MGSVTGLGTPRRAFRPSARATPRSPRGWPSGWPSTTTRCWPPTSTTRPALSYRRLPRRAGARRPGGPGASGVLRLGDHRRRRRRADRRASPELLPAADGDAAGPVSGTVFKVERGPAGEKIAYVRMFSGTVRRAGPAAAPGRRRGQGHRDQRLRPRLGRPARAGRAPGRSASSGGSATSRSATRSACRPRRRPRHRFAPPTLETVVVAPAPAGQGCAARRADPARRAGPADQPAPGRRPRRAARLALRRGAEGGHPGDAGRRLRHRRRVPRDDDDLHRAAGRHRRGGRGHRHAAQPVPRHGRAARRAGAGRTPACRSGSRSSSGRCRSRSSRRSRRPCRERCGRACTAGRSPTAWSP